MKDFTEEARAPIGAISDRDVISNLRAQLAAVEKERDELAKLLRSWAAFAKAMGLHRQRDGNLADYDDELASDIFEAAKATLEWRDKPS